MISWKHHGDISPHQIVESPEWEHDEMFKNLEGFEIVRIEGKFQEHFAESEKCSIDHMALTFSTGN